MALLMGVGLGSAACADGDAGGDAKEGGGEKPRLVVSAAASLRAALTACGPKFEAVEVRSSFAGSDELAAQIRQGLKPDVYAAANTTLPRELNEEGLLEKPVEFVANTLVVAVPRDSAIGSVEDLARDGVTLAIGSESVPVGSYTREVLSRLPKGMADAILANVRSNEPDVRGIVGKLTQGAADAGFVYASDVDAAGGGLRSVPLPRELQPAVVYAAGVVRGSKQPELARSFVDGLLDGRCHDALRDAGFRAPR